MRRRIALALLFGVTVFAAVAACVGDDPIATTPAGASDAAAPPATTTAPPSSTVPPPAPDAASGDDDDAGVDAAIDAGSFCEQRVTPALASESFCADFDDQSRDAGYALTVLDAGKFNRQTATFFSPPASVNADALASSVSLERGGWIHWDAVGTTPITAIDVRVKLKPNLDGLTHPIANGYDDLVTIGVGTDTTVVLRYTYGRDLVGHPNYKGYSLITLKAIASDGGADAGDAGGPNFDTTVATFEDLPNAAWVETWIHVTTNANGNGTMSLTLGDISVTGATNVVVPIFPATTGFAEIGNHGIGAMNASSDHYIDDVRLDVYR